jgi:sporulation-control protein
MVFDKIKAVLGLGVSIDTVLHDANVVPGGTLAGEVRISGGEVEAKVQNITLEYTALVEEDAKGEDRKATYDYFSAQVSGPFQLTPGTDQTIAFEAQVPWQTPFNTLDGRPLVGGMKLGVATTLALEQALDKGDLDALTVEPLPVQRAVMEAVEALGFTFQETDLEAGTVPGSQMPFYQEVEYWCTGDEFKERIDELEVTFVTGPGNTEVLFQADNQTGLISPADNTTARFNLPTENFGDVADTVREQLEQLLDRKGRY